MKTSHYFDPKTTKFPYPEITDKHYLVVKKNRGIVFDENYPYIDKSKGFLFKRWLVRVLLILIVFPITKIRLGLKVINKKSLKIHKKEIENGVIGVSNHVHMWDYLGVLRSIKPIKPYILSWATNINGENATLIRMVGGIPVPTDNYRGQLTFMKTIKELLTVEKGWLHICVEGSMWEYYAPIRPLKRGASTFAVRFNKPIIPMAYSYRKPSWIRRKIFHQIALFTLNIGEPLYPNENLPLEDREAELTNRLHDEMVRLAFRDVNNKLYPGEFNNNKRVDYYSKEYGKGYKGSH